jgi:hypothetical protein
MQSFGKAIRGSLPALGLGLITAFGVGSFGLATTPAAHAQKPAEASKEFVAHYDAAKKALDAQQYAEALKEADAAQSHAEGNSQKVALEIIRVACYRAMKNNAAAIKSIETAQALGLPAQLQKNYKDMLPGLYAATGNKAKAVELTKQQIAAGEGSAQKYGFVAKSELDAKDYKAAIADAQKAVQAAGGGAGAVDYWNIIIKAQLESKDMDSYYATLERVAPILKKEIYWRPLIERTMKEPKYKSQDALVDVMRTLTAANVSLQPKEQQDYGEFAYNRGSAVEAEKVLEPLVKSGAYGGATDKSAERNKKLFAQIQADAKADKAGDLAKTETDAATKATGEAFVALGESYMGAGDFAKAVEVFQKGITKGQLEPGALELAKLRLGIAQFKAGQKEEAKKTWATVKADNGASWLARCWTAISKA